MSARRFLWKWNARVIRGEWRQYAVIFAMITIAVALSTTAMTFIYNITDPPGAEGYGDANIVASVNGDPSLFETALTDQGHPFTTIASGKVIVPGVTPLVSVKVADPTNEIAAPLFTLLDGRWPMAPNEVAVTDRVSLDNLTTGQTVELNGQAAEVVGVFENPTDLNDEFVLATGLDDLDVATPDQSVEFLIKGNPEDIVLPPGIDGINNRSKADFLTERTVLTIMTGVISAIALLEVGLLVSAAFAVIARRRSRQYGLLAAAGATPRQIRASATAAGMILGVTASILGVALGVGFGAWAVSAVADQFTHRISFTIPLWGVIPNLVLAVAIAAVAARWPARAMSKQPVVALLRSMRARPEPVGRSVILGLILFVIGSVTMVIGFRQLLFLPTIAGVVMGPLGLLLLSPLLVRYMGKLAARLPLPARMGARATSRYNRRSAAMVAALGLALGIPAALSTTLKSDDNHQAERPPNIQPSMSALWLPAASDGSMFIPADYVDNEPDTATTHVVDEVATAMPNAKLAPIEVIVSSIALPHREYFPRLGTTEGYQTLTGMRPGTEGECGNSCNTTGFGEIDEDGNEIIYLNYLAWVATPSLLGALDIASAFDDPSSIAVATEDDMILFAGFDEESRTDLVFTEGIDTDTINGMKLLRADSTARTLVSPDWVAAQPGYRTATVGWVMVSPEPIAAETRTQINEIVGSNLVAEFNRPYNATPIANRALLVAIIVGLGIAAAAVTLLNGEMATDNRVLHSIGAPKATTRKTSAAIAALLAAAGGLIAVAIGYYALIPQLIHPTGDFPFVAPWLALGLVLILFPVLAAGIGWLTSRTSHRNLARPR